MATRIDYSPYTGREKRKAFTESLTPESPLPSRGLTMAECRTIAKSLDDDDIEIGCIEDVIIRAIMIFSRREPFCRKRERIETLLPQLVSWMITDTVSSSLWYAKREEDEVYGYFLSLVSRTHPMTRRLGIVALMDRDFLCPRHLDELLDTIADVRSEDYLLQMAVAWFFATAYTYHPDESLPFFARLDDVIRKRAVRKCRESRRITPHRLEALESFLERT